MFFHLSQEKLTNNILTPRVPRFAVSPFENTVIKRVCFSSEIKKCLKAFPSCESGSQFFVYGFSDKKQKVFKPKESDVFDVVYTNEVWVTNPIKVSLLGVIEITSCIKEYHRNQYCNCFALSICDYKWINLK